MALLHAAARVLGRDQVVVATFDHATGVAATRATKHAAAEAARLGFQAVIGPAGVNARSEAGWRAARHGFLRDVATAFQGRVMTAHTRDDQVETVFMRVLRGSGARGLAGLYATSEWRRPLLGFSRDEVTTYASEVGASWVEDPSNASTTHLRNRVRRDLLPALRSVAPALDVALLSVARRAARLRADVEGWLDAHVVAGASRSHARVRAASLPVHADAELRLLWPAIAARVGLAMDRRGTERAAAFTRTARAGARMPLSGGWMITRSRETFDLHRVPAPAVDESRLDGDVRWNDWRFSAERSPRPDASDQWVALLPAGASVRAWRPGDRLRAGGLDRRVKRYLSDAGITGEPRAGWPVVLSGQEIVWIPGVRRSDAASDRPGRPGVRYRCDYDRR